MGAVLLLFLWLPNVGIWNYGMWSVYSGFPQKSKKKVPWLFHSFSRPNSKFPDTKYQQKWCEYQFFRLMYQFIQSITDVDIHNLIKANRIYCWLNRSCQGMDLPKWKFKKKEKEKRCKTPSEYESHGPLLRDSDLNWQWCFYQKSHTAMKVFGSHVKTRGLTASQAPLQVEIHIEIHLNIPSISM